MTPYQRLLLPENLYYAWRKAAHLYRVDDGHTNQGELLEFELDLESRLKRIHRQFLKGRYKLKPIKPVPRPKKLKDGKYINRQYHHIAVDDQVAWIAVVNALGPALDKQMFPWSYGNRLYRSAWYEEARESRLEIGPYRHASGYLYKKFQHGWPLYRRHISLTAKKMVGSIEKLEESEPDQRAMEYAEKEGLPYLKEENYFKGRKNFSNTDLYYASIDLKQFYPSIPSNKILVELCQGGDIEEKLESLLKSMLNFSLDKNNTPNRFLEDVEPSFAENKVKGLPTGLFAAGFLANIAMLPVDRAVTEKLAQEKSVAHFRYVDDHTILTYEFDKLCEWYKWYKDLVNKKLSVEVNESKTDPESLLQWVNDSDKERGKSQTIDKEINKKTAKEESRIDGKNPIKLMTKTLEKISMIAAQDINVLDEHDLRVLLKDLEWLLLADIPDREIRPDTRASFSAGKITELAQVLTQELDSIVDLHRKLAHIEDEIHSIEKYSENIKESINKKKEVICKRLKCEEKKLRKDEAQHLTKCFNLLLQAMKKHPGKVRVFFRLHQYCLQTGHKGLNKIIAWSEGLRNQKSCVWADYYASLTLQILAKNILKALQVITNPSSLRSDQYAARRYLKDITTIDQSIFKNDSDERAWFHEVARHEYGASASIAAEYLKLHGEGRLASRYEKIVEYHQNPKLSDASSVWLDQTGYASGNWAYLAERSLSFNSSPTHLWKIFSNNFDYINSISDQNAVKLYPELLPEKAWKYFLASSLFKAEDNSGWIYEILKSRQDWVEDASKASKNVFKRAARVFNATKEGDHISISDWTNYISTEIYSPFDPRLSEWTALEIIRQLIQSYLEYGKSISLELVHPQNVLIPKKWTELELSEEPQTLRWEKWRSYIEDLLHQKKPLRIKISKLQSYLLDYRYHSYKYDKKIPEDSARIKQENKFFSIGRLLLELLNKDHSTPAIWNIRGNERAINFPRTEIFRSLAISSPTLLLIESCIDPRSAESRLMMQQPSLFGLQDNEKITDMQYDPPPLRNLNNLFDAIINAQNILNENQLAVSMHQPRQLIPFRISDFATSKFDEDSDD